MSVETMFWLVGWSQLIGVVALVAAVVILLREARRLRAKSEGRVYGE